MVECLPSNHEALSSILRANKSDLMIYTCNPRTQEVVEAGGSGVQDQLKLHSEFEASLDYLRTCFKTTNKKI